MNVLVLVTLILVLVVCVGLILYVDALNVQTYQLELETRDRDRLDLADSLKTEKETKALHQAFAAATLHEIRLATTCTPCLFEFRICFLTALLDLFFLS